MKSYLHPLIAKIYCDNGVHEWAVEFVSAFVWYKCLHCPAERVENN